MGEKTMDRMVVELAINSARRDGIREGLERAARWHDAMADLKERVAEKQLPRDKVLFSAEAVSHRKDAAAIRALKEE